MKGRRAARGSSGCRRAKYGSRRTGSIVPDYDRACLAASLVLGVSFGLMLLWAAVMW